MPRPKRQAALPIEVFEEHDANGNPTGVWHGYLPVVDEHGKPVLDGRGKQRRLHRQAGGESGRKRCEQKIRELMDEMAAENARRLANPRPTSTGRYRLHDWLRYWLNEIKKPNVGYNTYDDYVYAIEGLVIPNIEDVWLDELRAHHIESMLRALRATGSRDKPHRGFTRLRMALKAAAARPRETNFWDNPIGAVDTPPDPALLAEEIQPPSPEQVRAFIAAARRRRNSARWTVCSVLGERPGETLAHRREDFWIVDATTRQRVPGADWAAVDVGRQPGRYIGYLRVRENLYRRRWEHGCADPHNCNGGRYHRAEPIPCPGRGPRHDRYHKAGITCPPIAKPCSPRCTKHGRMCPKRHGGLGSDGTPQPGGQVRKDPKSRAGKRAIRLHPAQTIELINHLAMQDAERAAAQDQWRASGALFATELGGLINERDDWEYSKAILAEIGIAESRPYDVRHGAATIALINRVEPRVVMEAMGWSSPAMLKRYQHVVDEMRGEFAGALGAELYDEPDATDPASATDHATDLHDGNVVPIKGRRKRAA